MTNLNISSGQIELLVALTETGSFSEAAKRLGLTQSAVSHSLARLESELGVVLVERGRRGINLTPTGAAILPYAREVRTRLEAIRQVSAAAVGEAQGKVRLGIAPPFPAATLARIVRAFHEAYPGVELVISEDAMVTEKPSLADGRLDVVFAPDTPPGTQSVAFGEETIVAVLPVDHPLAATEAITAAALVHEPLILPRYGRDAIGERLRRERDTERSPVRHFVSTTSAALALVDAGLGIALIAQSELASCPTTLVQRPLAPPLLLPLVVAVRSWESLSPVAQAFVDVALTTRDAPELPRLSG